MNENFNPHENYPDSQEKIDVPTMKVIPLKKICMTIGQIPTAYLETMSYYEMLIWFIEYLKNNIIPTINNNASAVQEVQSVVLQLQNYINNFKNSIDEDVEDLENYMNNYFDNLDVQDEINNKLDQMLEDGVLTEIIQQFLQSTAIWCFDNVADMKAATNLIDGSYARTLGYYEANDGGGATYKIVNTQSQTDYQEELNNGLFATLIVKDVINVKQIGIMNDKDNSTILNNFMQNYSKYNIYFPKDYYYFSEPITMAKGIAIFGDFASNYGLPSTYQTASLHFAKSAFIDCDKNTFRNLSIYGSSRTESNFYCGFKRKNEGNACSIENCNISYFHAGIHGNSKGILVFNSIISDCDIGILDFTDGRIINNTITRCYDGIRNTDQGDDTISQNRIEWCTRYGIFLTRGKHYIITDNLIDRCSKQGLRCENVLLINVIGNYFRRNYAGDSSAGNNHSHVVLSDCIDINFNSNNGSSEYITDGDTSSEITPYNGIYLYNNKNINLVGNNFANVVSKPYVLGRNYSNVNIDDYTLNYTQQHTVINPNNSSEVSLPIYYNMNDAEMPFGFKLIVESRDVNHIESSKVEEFIIYQASEYLLNNQLTSNDINILLSIDRTNGFIIANLSSSENKTYSVTLKLKAITYPSTLNYKFYNHLS